MDEKEALTKDGSSSALSVKGSVLADQLIESAFSESTPDLSLARLQRQLDELASYQPGEAKPLIEKLIDSMGHFFLGVKAMQAQNFSVVGDHFRAAAHGFDETHQMELRDAAAGLAIYGTAIAELQASNIGRALELFKQVRDYLNRAGKFGQTFKQLVDQMQPENLFIQAMQMMVTTRDFAGAKTLIEQAAQAATKVADDYYEPGTPLHYMFLGAAHYYKAFYMVIRTFTDLNQFKYDSVAAEIDLKRDAVQASEYLSKADTNNQIVGSLFHVSQGHIELLELFPEFASLMQKVLNSSFKAEPGAYSPFRQRVRRANEHYAQAGPSAAILDSLKEPLQQLSRWSILTLCLVGLSVGLVIVGAASALFWHTQTGLLTSVSSLLTSIISGMLLVQLRKAEAEVKLSRADILKQFQAASDRFFAGS